MTSYKIAGPDIVFEEFDDDLVVLNLSTGQYFDFNKAAQSLWDVLSCAGDVNEIGRALKNPHDLAPFVEDLIRYQLLAEGSDTQPLSETAIHLLQEITEKPTVDRYDDLADLIVADPIHDVDTQEGWPVLDAKTS